MSGLPEIHPRRLAPPGTLAAAILADPQAWGLSLLGEAPPAASPRPARIELEAFRTTSPETAERLGRVLAGEGLVVTTGQQPVLFLGPLYVLYKALSAIRTAARIEAALGVPVVPVFWIASDDHDWEEIGQVGVLDDPRGVRTLRLPPPPGFERRPAGSAPLGEAIVERMAELAQLVPETEFTRRYLDPIRDAYTPGATVGGAFGEALAAVLQGFEFAWLDSAEPAVKIAAAGFYRPMLEDPGPALEALNAGVTRVVERGQVAPIAGLPGALPLFWDTGEARERLYAEGGGIRAGKTGDPEPRGTWLRRLEEAPGRFSPNVSSRPVLESWLLPVGATVLGPGELAYWSQLPPLFDARDVPFPALRPRGSWTLVEPRVRRLLARIDAEPEDLADGGDAVVERITREARPETVTSAVAALRDAVGTGMGTVREALAGAFPGLRSAAGKTEKALFDALAALERQIDQAAREAQETRIEQARRAALHLFPERRPQERVLSPLGFLARYGPDLLAELAEAEASE